MIFSIIEQQLVAGLAGSIDMKQRGEIADIPQSSNFAGRVAENRTTKLSRFFQLRSNNWRQRCCDDHELSLFPSCI